MKTALAGLILNQSPIGVVAFNAAYCICHVNAAFTNLTGLAAATVAGLGEADLSALLAERCAPGSHFAGLAELRSRPRGATSRAPVSLLKMAGTTGTYIEIEWHEVCNGDLSRLLFFRNVTGEAQNNAELLRLFDKAAHELRTPMVNVFGYSELLMQNQVDAATQEEIHGVVFRNADLMRSMVTGFFDLARVALAKTATLRHVAVNMQTVLMGSLAKHPPPAGRLPPTVELPQPELWVCGDGLQLDEAIGQLLSNAYKFSASDSQVEIRLFRRDLAGGGSEIGLSIRDHGICMTEAVRRRAGEPFYRADSSGHIPGNGLGLSIANAILLSHRGRLEIHSEPGTGTEAVLFLPALERVKAAA